MAVKIPVPVITGFLGSGKTNLIRHLLQNNQGRRIAGLVNEFGKLGIDSELLKYCQLCPEDEADESHVFELTNGCLCCTVQEELFPKMQQLLKQRDSINCILIETHQQEIYRIKGFVAVPNKPMRLVLQVVATRFDKFYDRPWQLEEARQTRLVFIGHDLKLAEIESQLIAL